MQLFSLLSNFEPPQLTSAREVGTATVQTGSKRSDQQNPARELQAGLVTRYAAGATVKALAAEHGLHHQTVRAVLVRAGSLVRTRQRLAAADVEQILALYQAGQTTSEIGDRFGVYASTIGRQLQKLGVELRAPARRPTM